MRRSAFLALLILLATGVIAMGAPLHSAKRAAVEADSDVAVSDAIAAAANTR